ncbi:hypothetical protein [Thalassospira sp.]|uniref:hypothetical protein n=1 Tax=Thalassospira sp. TaxID=1912094 RepID=UPI000C58EFA1|nr:hypothetical protein [Thalassospira sp.]MBC06992.1 hypothetical protein [Thalassospira sp.]|tara:strand:- start:10207 stop:10704 length:498 start_codon:yes stop_codon:yes gene_type:complete
MHDASDIELAQLPDGVDGNIRAFVDSWYEALGDCREGELPSRAILNAQRLARWRDDISIYEFQPEKDDFLIRLSAPSSIESTGENFQGSTPRVIDLKYGTFLMQALRKTLQIKRPTFHHISVDGLNGERQYWLRVLLPCQTSDHFAAPVYQVLGARFASIPMHKM